MKNYFALSLLVISLLYFSCGKDDPTPSTEFLTAKIDGVDYSGMTIRAIDGIVSFQISGVGDEGDMAFGLNGVAVAVGTYDFDGNTCIGSLNRDTDTWTAEDGSLVITKYEDGKIEGTFNFIGDNILGHLDPNALDITVTEGRFSANY